jgi:hypothetical protein
MELSPEDSAKISTLHEDYRTLQDAMWSAESNKEQLCLAFREDLDVKVADLRKQVLDIRLIAQHDMLLDPTTDMHEAHVRPCLHAHVCFGEFPILKKDSLLAFIQLLACRPSQVQPTVNLWKKPCCSSVLGKRLHMFNIALLIRLVSLGWRASLEKLGGPHVHRSHQNRAYSRQHSALGRL